MKKITSLLFLVTLLFFGTVSAQTVLQSKLNCTSSHCTSKDLSVVDVYVDVPPCATCGNNNVVTAPLKMVIHNGTKSVRTSFALWGTLSAGASIGGISGNIFICVGPITVKSDEDLGAGPGNQTFTVGTITFNCGQNLTLSNNLLAWTDASGTTADRCATFANATQCKDLEPKCGEATSIIIRQPLSAQSSATASCTNSANGSVTVTPSGGKAPYDITIDGTTTNNVLTATKSSLGVGTYNWSITDDAGCTTSGTQSVTGVAPPTVYTLTGSAICGSSTGTVTLSNSQTGVSYQLKNAANANVQSAKSGTGSSLQWTGLAAGTYHVVATGAAPTSCTSTTGDADVTIAGNPTVFNPTGSAICASAPGTGTVTTSNSQSGVSYQLKDAGDNDVQSAKSGTGSGLTWTSLPAGTYHIVATSNTPPNCTSTSNSATVSVNQNPGDPTSEVVLPLCTDATMTVQITNFNNALTYSLTQPNNNSPFAPDGTGKFTGLAFGAGYTIIATDPSTNCPSGTDMCGGNSSPLSTPRTTPAITEQTTTIKAFPNPFNDKVRFVVTAARAGNGTLEVFNMTGQKVKTVFQGHVNAGNNNFEMSLPGQKNGGLIYRLTIDGKGISGKLLQLGN